MHWLSFFIGALVGWIAEWFIDLSYWRHKYTGMVEAEAEARTQLVNAQGELETLGAQLAGYQEIETQLAACRNELQTRIQAVEGLNSALVAAKADVDALRTQLAESEAAHQAQVHKLQAVLSAARDEIGTLRTQRARQPKPPTVARAVGAAGVAAAVVAGVERGIGVTGDDLTQIEGIDPRISMLLKLQGIRTFAQLAGVDSDRLRAILDQAGPDFQLASPESWPEQARLAAGHAWEELQVLQDRLTAGREDS